MKYIIVYLICFFIFCAWLFYEQRKRQRLQNKATQDFWAREEAANSTRKKDISHLPLLKPTEEEIPLSDAPSESVLYYIDKIRQNIQMPMIDLSEYSNTDLKLAYGVGNFKTLSDYDENFNTFLTNLTNLARAYTANQEYSLAEATYEMAFRYGSKKVSDYTDLAQVYLSMDKPDLVNGLIRRVDESEHPRKETIIRSLRQVLSSYQ